MPFPFVKQPDAMDCGPACLTMIAQNEYCIMFF
ncbi:cysteine peptidase family C39 domain-containing protein [Tannerella forsythia]